MSHNFSCLLSEFAAASLLRHNYWAGGLLAELHLKVYTSGASFEADTGSAHADGLLAELPRFAGYTSRIRLRPTLDPSRGGLLAELYLKVYTSGVSFEADTGSAHADGLLAELSTSIFHANWQSAGVQ